LQEATMQRRRKPLTVSGRYNPETDAILCPHCGARKTSHEKLVCEACFEKLGFVNGNVRDRGAFGGAWPEIRPRRR
jgi:hypothetical protein